ncbi:MAG: DUF2520 domain-containing protein [Actinomycetota bacterium]|nr:DUF2520 domain-containing protein [Actinomycetota bacterium]
MKLIVVGPGRAGGSIALAASRTGHEITGVLSRSTDTTYGPVVSWDEPLPPADLLLIATRDEAIEEVARRLSSMSSSIPVAAHVSGFTPVAALRSLAEAGLATGGFHPLQTLPDPERGAIALTGAFVGIGGDPMAQATLTRLGLSLGMRPFVLDDESRPGYHAGAAAASNFVITALETAGDLMSAAGVEPAVARPLVDQAVANVYAAGAASPLTGPIARGDTATVIGQLEAAHEVSEDVGDQYRLMAEATAIRAGRRSDVKKWS